MIFLEKTLRNGLSRTVLAARQLAEEAARKALHSLGVDEADPPGHLDTEGRKLRVKLRAQARQLGDKEDAKKKGCYEIGHLAEKIAYDQWHRMLFARFLAENDLLISPDHGVGASLADCEEFAPMLGLRDGWEVAASFAARMLPQIFRADDPAGQIVFAPEDRLALRKLVTDLPADVFKADDSLGWVYQFWQARRKDEVNDSGAKIGADELAPVTQLFTEDYMVLFLLHNTLGAWWAGKHKAALAGRRTEEECRKAVALPGVGWEYLRFVRDEQTGEWKPAAGVFEGWPKVAKELRVLDPCMGSGHFVVTELPILAAMRMKEEGLSKAEAVAAVLRDNLFGLELDFRCTQIAAFNLALAGWKLTEGFRELPPLNLACSGLAPNTKKEDWLKLAGDNEKLKNGMERLYCLFQNAPVLGSLVNPRAEEGDVLAAAFHDLQPLLEKALLEETKDDNVHEMAVTARGLAKAAEILAGQFTLVATNVPYLGRGKQEEALQEYCERLHGDSKADLANCFLERCMAFCSSNGTSALVTPQNWFFQGSYRKARARFLRDFQWNAVAQLGEEAWQSFGIRGPRTVLITLTAQIAKPTNRFLYIDVSTPPGHSPILIEHKVEMLCRSKTTDLKTLSQSDQLANVGAVVGVTISQKRLFDYADTYEGLSTGDLYQFIRCFWEMDKYDGKTWASLIGAVGKSTPYGGREQILLWEEGCGRLVNFPGSAMKGEKAWGHSGLRITLMRTRAVTVYTGELFDKNAGTLIPKTIDHALAIMAFCLSPEFESCVATANPGLYVPVKTLLQVPFDLEYWQKVAAEKYPRGLPKPFSSDPTQWLFNGHPKGADQPLQVAVARLLGYRWPRQTGSEFPDCPALGPDGLEEYSDDDGVVCLNAIQGERPAVERVRGVLAAAYGGEWSEARQAELLAQVGYEGKTLEQWLRNGFFEQHCQVFHQRPFIWQIWDGLKDGFSALVNYHRLDRRLLGKLTYTYLGDWIARQKAAVSAGEEGSDAKLAAALKLKAALEKILEGEAPYDIFVRWKPLEKQPVGWEPDLNDGVRMNIRPFIEAGVLRKPPKIKWNKDRGTDVASAPWYKVFRGERINDHHLTLAEKRKARGT